MAASTDYSRTVTGGSDEVKDILCEPCEQDGRQTDAEGFCVDCSEYMCGQCYKNHKLFKAFRNHVLKDKGIMPQSVTGVGVKDKCTTLCDLHKDKVTEYFCGSCDKLGCTTCITLDHRRCEKVEHIPKKVEASTINEEFKTYINKVHLISNQLQERKSILKSMASTTDNMRKMAKTELKNQRAEVNKFFDDLEKEMDTVIDEIQTSNTAIVTEASNMYDTMDKDLKEFETNFSTKQNAGQHCEAFIHMKQSVIDIDAIEKRFQNMQSESKILKYELLPSSQLEDMKKKVTELCRLETETVLLDSRVTQAAGKQQVPITTSPVTVQDTTKKTTLNSLRLNTEINVSTTNDQQSSYARGLTMIHDHFIVVVDRPNNAVKVFDIRNKDMISEMVMDKAVWSVTKVNDDKIAIGMKSAIQFLTVSKSGLLREDSAFETKMTCFDVVHSNGKLIVAEGSFVEILNMQGKVLKALESSCDGEQMFTSCYGLAISKDHKTIYASDNTKNTVTSMTLDGKVKDIYRDNDLKNPWGMTVDDEGNVCVCCCGLKSMKTVHQLSADCNKLQVFQDMPGGSISCTNKQLLVGGVENLRIYDIV